jgi:BioD-like phosphotransacetylase family protein
MGKGLYIGATTLHAGKNMLSVGLGLRLQKEGLSLGYMKPVGVLPTEKRGLAGDEDALFVSEVLGLDDAPDLISPVLVNQDFQMRIFAGAGEDFMPGIARAYAALSRGRDLTLVCGTNHCLSGKYCGLDGVRIARELGLKVLLLDRLGDRVNLDEILALKETFGDALAGVVINDVPVSFMEEIDSVIRPFLKRNGVRVIGVIPRDMLMGAIRAHELADGLGGKLVASASKADGMVENFLIGTMQVENFITYFRRNPHAAVIVGGDRADIQLVAIEGNCPCLVLTGNLFPNDIILSRANTLNVPIIMVRQDTYKVAKRMESLLNRHKMRDVMKIRQGVELVGNNLNFDAIREELGLR